LDCDRYTASPTGATDAGKNTCVAESSKGRDEKRRCIACIPACHAQSDALSGGFSKAGALSNKPERRIIGIVGMDGVYIGFCVNMDDGIEHMAFEALDANS